MFGRFDKYIAVFLTGLLVTYWLTPWVRHLATRIGMVDQPGERRAHKHPTARGGGLAVILGVHAACMVAFLFPWPELAGGLDLHWWRHFLLASLVLLIVGLVDDFRGLPPLAKLAGQIAAALIMVLSGARFGSLFGVSLPPFVDGVMVVFWIIVIINAFNLIDGLDGLASGLALISAVGLCGVFALNQLPGNILVLLGLVGACLAFLRYNFHPATIFLGDTGSMFLGFLLATVSLQTFNKSTFLLSLAIPTLVLGVPLYDELLAVWRRSVRRWLKPLGADGGGKAKGVMQADMDHLHHRLVRAGLTTRRVTGVLFVFNAALVAFFLLLALFESHAAGIFLFALLVAAYVLLRHLAVTELRDTGRVILAGLRRPTHATFKAMGYPLWDMIWLSGAVATSMAFFEQSQTDHFWRGWFLELPVWVTPTFSLLAASRTYVTVWYRARMLDVLMLGSMLMLGLLISLGLALLIEPGLSNQWLIRAFLIAAVAHPAILLLRLIYRFIEEIVLYLRNRSEVQSSRGRVLLFGAGGRCQLYLREQAFYNSSSFDGRRIVGLVDDEPSLGGRWVFGYPVLGGSKDLSQLISRHRITDVIITANLRPESRERVREAAREQGVRLSEWAFWLKPVETGGAGDTTGSDRSAGL